MCLFKEIAANFTQSPQVIGQLTDEQFNSCSVQIEWIKGVSEPASSFNIRPNLGLKNKIDLLETAKTSGEAKSAIWYIKKN